MLQRTPDHYKDGKYDVDQIIGDVIKCARLNLPEDEWVGYFTFDLSMLTWQTIYWCHTLSFMPFILLSKGSCINHFIYFIDKIWQHVHIIHWTNRLKCSHYRLGLEFCVKLWDNYNNVCTWTISLDHLKLFLNSAQYFSKYQCYKGQKRKMWSSVCFFCFFLSSVRIPLELSLHRQSCWHRFETFFASRIYQEPVDGFFLNLPGCILLGHV